MCGRYTFFMRGRDLEDRVEDDVTEAASWREDGLERYQPSYNVAPSTDNPVVTGENTMEITLYSWGLVPSWADDAGDWELINARSESVDEKPAFRDAFRSRRCLVPAQGFYEWMETDIEGKQPYRIVPKDDPDDLFYFAGVYEPWTPPEQQKELGGYGGGSRDAGRSELMTYSILTEPANDAIAEIHDRMPVMLDGDELQRWLQGEEGEARELLDSHETASEELRCYPVSKKVNDPSNDSPEVIVES